MSSRPWYVQEKAPPAPPAPSGFKPAAFFSGDSWHQKWEIFKGVYTPGRNPIDWLCTAMELPVDLTGKRVLDVGAWNGCLSFECERRGAAEVVALGPEDPTQTGFLKVRDLIGSKRVHYRIGSVYDLDPDVLGTFNVVLFCGVLYHLRYPLLGIDNLRRVATGEVYVETYVCDDSLLGGKRKRIKNWLLRYASPILTSRPYWIFYPNDELEKDPSNWFGPNAHAVVEGFNSAGFDMRLTRTWPNRAAFHARVRAGLPEFLTNGSGESAYYGTLIKHLFGNKPFVAPRRI